MTEVECQIRAVIHAKDEFGQASSFTLVVFMDETGN